MERGWNGLIPTRDRMERFAVLVPEARIPALTAKQQAILAELAGRDRAKGAAALAKQKESMDFHESSKKRSR